MINYINDIFSYKTLINTRNFFINNFNYKILGVVEKDNYKKSNFPLILISYLPFFISNRILSYFGIKFIYEKDNLIYSSNENQSGISPLISKIILKKNDGDLIDIKEIYSKYGNNVPINIIFSNEEISVNDEDELFIKYFSSGKFIEKSFNYKKIKLYLKIELLK